MATIGGSLRRAVPPRLMRGLEETLGRAGVRRVAGVDEAGRGCLAGPVVAAAVVPDPAPSDSRRRRPQAALTAPERERLAGRSAASALAFAVAAVPRGGHRPHQHPRGDAPRRCASALGAARRSVPTCVVTDAVPLAGLGAPLPRRWSRATPVSYAVACASILAKVERDRLLTRARPRLPAVRLRAPQGLRRCPSTSRRSPRYGPSPVHRLTFAPVVPRRGGRPPDGAQPRAGRRRSAEKLVARGKIDAAIKEYRKLLAENAERHQHAQPGRRSLRPDRAHRRGGRASSLQIAERYTDDGFFVKAIAIYKKIIKLDPTRLRGLREARRALPQAGADQRGAHAVPGARRLLPEARRPARRRDRARAR